MTTTIPAAVSFELTKIRTLRSTVWCFSLFLFLGLAFGVPSGYYITTSYDTPEQAMAAGADPAAIAFSGFHLGLIVLVVFSVLTVTSEYSTGSIRSSLAAVPRRGVFYGTKLFSAGILVLVLSLVSVLAVFLATQAAMGDYGVGLGEEGVLRSLLAGVLYLTLLSVFSMGVAAVLRGPALSIGILAPLFLTVSTILSNIPRVREVARYLPDQAGLQMMARGETPDGALTPGGGLLVLLAWTVTAVAAGQWAVSRRDQ